MKPVGLSAAISGGTVHERTSAHRRDSRADAIAAQANAARLDRLSAALEAAVLTETEQRAQAHQIELVLPEGRVELLEVDAARAGYP